MTIPLTNLRSPPTEHVVAGQTLNFYPLSPGGFFRIRNLSKPLISAISFLFSDQKNDSGKTVKNFFDGKDNTGGSETKIDPVPLSVIQYRDAQRVASLNSVVDTLTDSVNFDAVIEIIVDSLRDNFPRPRSKADVEVAEFKNGVDLPILVELINGVLKANAKVLGPLGERLQQAVRETISPKLQPEVSQVSPEPTAASGNESNQNRDLRLVEEDQPSSTAMPTTG